MDFLLDALTDWLKEMLVGGIMSNLSGMFDSVNQQVADIATQVGQTPQGWNGSIFSMIQNLSNSIMVPIAGVILAIVMTLELIQMITDKNNLHDVDTWMIFKWVFKSAAAILIVSNTWNIVMGVFDAAQSVVAQAAGIIGSDASIDISSVMTDMESRLMDMDLSNNLIMVDRKLLKNPNGLILGTPGSGKSFSAKREIANCFLLTNDDIIICDPEAEYAPLVERLHGQVIKISPTSSNYINPMDLNLDYSDDESPLSLKSDFILSLCELIVGGKEGLQPVQKTIIDRCVRLVYQDYLNDPRPENMPILEDLYNLLRAQDEKEAQYIATALEIYVTGSLNVFNHQSNVDINNRIVCYDIKELGKQLKKIGMLVVQDQVWNRVTINRAAHKSTRYYIDEMHLLLKEEQTAAYTVEIWKRFRKWGGIPTGITQNVKDLLSSREVENIFENSDFVYMLNQAGGDRQILAKQLGISPHQLSYVTHSSEGEGLLFYGSTILPFVDHFPKNTELYRIMTTKPQELKKEDE